MTHSPIALVISSFGSEPPPGTAAEGKALRSILPHSPYTSSIHTPAGGGRPHVLSLDEHREQVSLCALPYVLRAIHSLSLAPSSCLPTLYTLRLHANRPL